MVHVYYDKGIKMTLTQLCKKYDVDVDSSLVVKAQTLISLHGLKADYIKKLYHAERRMIVNRLIPTWDKHGGSKNGNY